MAVDPLTPATRLTKRNLLAVSMAAITYKAFNVSVDTIPIAGLNVHFDKGAFAFLLISSLGYFWLTFVLYFIIDIRNLDKAPHEAAVEEAFKRKRSNFRYHSAQRMLRKIQVTLPANYLARLDDETALKLLEKSEHKRRSVGYSEVDELGFRLIQFNLKVGPNSYRRLEVGEVDRDQFKRALKIAAAHLNGHGWRTLLYRIALLLWLWPVRLLYLVRNYGTDGLLPIALPIFAIAAIYDVVNVHWMIQALLPSGAR